MIVNSSAGTGAAAGTATIDIEASKGFARLIRITRDIPGDVAGDGRITEEQWTAEEQIIIKMTAWHQMFKDLVTISCNGFAFVLLY